MSFVSLAQSEFNFFGFGFNYIDYTSPQTKMESLLIYGPVKEPVLWSDGFNLFEINIDKKTFTHNYVNETGLGETSTITNLIKTEEYIKFNVTSKKFGPYTCMISLNTNSKYGFIVKYNKGNKTQIAFF
jgi:hypothetical protein